MRQWILHVDMDAFYASIEQLDAPEYRGKPVIVGGAERGVVSTCSYEARKYGVRSAMPTVQARKLCPHGIFLPCRMGRYQEVSQEVMAVLRSFSPLVEQASVDEAYLDFTGLGRLHASVGEAMRELQQAVEQRTGLTCSLGVAPVKFVAKIASDMRKPQGLTIISHEMLPSFLAELPVQKIPGVGKRTLELLHALGVHVAGDVGRFSQEFWERKLGKGGVQLFERAQGIDRRVVMAYTPPKSESAENTFERDITEREALTVWLLRHAERVGRNLRRQGLSGRTITLKVKYDNFTQVTRSRTLKQPTHTTAVIYATAVELLDELGIQRPLRLIGVGVSLFGEVEQQLSLLPEPGVEEGVRDEALDTTLDVLRSKYGNAVVMRGKLFS